MNNAVCRMRLLCETSVYSSFGVASTLNSALPEPTRQARCTFSILSCPLVWLRANLTCAVYHSRRLSLVALFLSVRPDHIIGQVAPSWLPWVTVIAWWKKFPDPRGHFDQKLIYYALLVRFPRIQDDIPVILMDFGDRTPAVSLWLTRNLDSRSRVKIPWGRSTFGTAFLRGYHVVIRKDIQCPQNQRAQ